jgi:bifunctional ADP-heptose synthase (sugar kinase/adenylyltransferase)|tara:strand:+ start:499 stop:696 length:198 start_codon:yes stop_codon:yes gene_type:complete
MDKEKMEKIIIDPKSKGNSDITEVMLLLKNNYEDTKKLVVELTYRLDSIEEKYNKLNSELKKRVK